MTLNVSTTTIGEGQEISSTNWWSLWSGQQVLLGGKRLIIFTVQNPLNMFLSGLSSIQKEKYVERDDMVYEERIDRLVYQQILLHGL